jgi:hypothetical protein
MKEARLSSKSRQTHEIFRPCQGKKVRKKRKTYYGGTDKSENNIVS